MKSYSIIWLFLNIQKYLILSDEINNNFECPINTPLLVINSESNDCVYEPYNVTIHKISNKIIKTQWLNKINELGVLNTWYMSPVISSKGDLIIESLIYLFNFPFKDRHFYGIKSNGRPLFYDQETDKFINQIFLQSTSDEPKFESIMIRIKLANTDDNKEYYLSSCFEGNTIDIIDFYNNQVIGKSQFDLLGYSIWHTKFYSILELKNEDKTYMFCFIGNQDNVDYISFQKFQFNNPNISQENSYIRIASSPENEEFQTHSSYTLTCIEIYKFNLIQCFYLNIIGNYTVGLFKEDTLEFIYYEIIDEAPQDLSDNEWVDLFYRCIYLKNEVTILAYMLNKFPDCIYIQLKNLIYNKNISNYELEDYLIKYKKIEVKIEGNTKFNKYYYLSDLKKINNNRFSLISAYDYEVEEAFDLYIIIFDIYNFHDTNLFIRYYYIQMKFYNIKVYRFLLSIEYNGFLGLIYSIKKIGELFGTYQKFVIFSYINSTDSELINLDINSFLKLKDYINDENIENNIFGVDLYGIKILKLPNSKVTGVYFFSKLKNQLIFENDILTPEDLVYFIYDYTSLKKGNEIYTIEMAGVVQEKEYSRALEFTIYNKFYGKNDSPEIYYKRKIYLGRSSFYNFTIPNALNGNNDNTCKDNCKVCYNSYCIKCQDGFNLIEDTNICQAESPYNNYYFDDNYNIYKKCHNFCKSCSQSPKYYNDILELEDTNCIECIEDYYKVENTNNCINKNNIPETYFYDSNKELVRKCFENCKTCNQDKINSTYYSCISCDENSILYEKSGNCLNCYSKGKYANHYENECSDIIPEGYYLEDEQTNAIAKCYFSCKKCETGGDSNDHKCTECGDNYPYRNKEGTKCLEDCSKEYLYTDMQTKRCYNDCKDNIAIERIYNYKNICYSIADKSDNLYVDENNFIKCNNETGFYFNNKCYKICPNITKFEEFSNSSILNNLFYLKEGKQICVDSDICPIEYPYLKPNTSECSKKCYYKYNNECYSSCPNNTYINQTINDINICVDIITEAFTEMTTERTAEIIAEISTSENQMELIETEGQIKSEKFFEFSKVLDEVGNLDNKNNIVINDYPNITINIYINGIDIDKVEEKNSNLTFIYLEECGENLKKFYNLDPNENLYIVSFENYNNTENKVTNEFKYEIYLKNGTELEDLSVCNDITISVSSPICNFDMINFDEAEIFIKQGYNIYNLSSEFYTDKCSGANINGNDIVLKDRIEEIYPNNVSFCSNGCELNNVKIESKRIKCTCNISNNEENVEINNNQTQLNVSDDNFLIYLLDSLNYKIFECYKIIIKLKFKDVIKNTGFFFGLGFLIFNIICCFIFAYHYLPQIRIQIYKLLPNNKNLLKEKKNKKISKKNKNISKKNKKIFKRNKISKNEINSKNILLINFGKKKTKKIKCNSNNKFNKNKILKKRNNKIFDFRNETAGHIVDIEENDYNYLPYSQALILDKRNIFIIYISLIKNKIDIISILFYPVEFTHKSLTLCVYMLDFLFSFFINALLYTDDVVSEKYHNNGQLDLFTTLFLSLTSNIISFIIMYVIKKIVTYNEYLSRMVKDVHKKNEYILTFKKLYLVLKIKVFFFFNISFILSLFITIYLLIFCQIYKNSQASLIINYLMGYIESLAYSVGVPLIICILRYLGLKRKLIYIYRTSVYLDELL